MRRRAIAGIRQRGGIAVVIAHRPSALVAVDRVLVMAEGRMQGDLYDVAVALDAIDKLSERTGRALPVRRRERDELLARLQVVGLSAPPLVANAA